MISVLIVGSIRLYREGLVLLLSRRPELHVLGASSGRDDALVKLASRPDIVLLDLAISDSESILADVKRLASASAIVGLGLLDPEGDAIACIEAGVAGFVSREASLDELVRVIETAARGELQCTPQLAGTLSRRIAALASVRAVHSSEERLTARECQVVRLIEQNLTNKEIATELGIEVATVKNHVHNLLEKLHVHRRCDVVMAVRPACYAGRQRTSTSPLNSTGI
jgi:two-component system nitrate/nitrite response regulator NarL